MGIYQVLGMRMRHRQFFDLGQRVAYGPVRRPYALPAHARKEGEFESEDAQPRHPAKHGDDWDG